MASTLSWIGGWSSEQGICSKLNARVLRVEGRDGEGGSMADIQLEMQQTFREEENVPFVQHGGIELVVGVPGTAYP